MSRSLRALLVTASVAIVVLGTAPPAATECGGLYVPFPAFTQVAPSARRVIVGRVVADLTDPDDPDPGLLVRYRVEVEEVLRGRPVTSIDVEALGTRVPFEEVVPGCPQPPLVYAHLGDRIAIAFHGRLAGVDHAVNTAAWITGEPPDADRGAERLTIAQVRRAVAGLPDTGTASRATASSEDGPPIVLLTLGALAGAAAWIGRRRCRMPTRSGWTR